MNAYQWEGKVNVKNMCTYYCLLVDFIATATFNSSNVKWLSMYPSIKPLIFFQKKKNEQAKPALPVLIVMSG